MPFDFLLSSASVIWTELLSPVLISLIACTGFGIMFNIRGKNLLLSAFCGAISWMVYLITIHYANDMLACFLGGLATSLFAEILARLRRTPSTCFLIIGLLPLVPGAGIYYTMKYFVQGQYVEFAGKGITVLSCAGAIALGVMLVISVFRMLLHIKILRSQKAQHQ